MTEQINKTPEQLALEEKDRRTNLKNSVTQFSRKLEN